MVIFRAAAILDSGTEIGVWLALVRLMKLGYCEAYTAFKWKHIALIGIWYIWYCWLLCADPFAELSFLKWEIKQVGLTIFGPWWIPRDSSLSDNSFCNFGRKIFSHFFRNFFAIFSQFFRNLFFFFVFFFSFFEKNFKIFWNNFFFNILKKNGGKFYFNFFKSVFIANKEQRANKSKSN